MASGGNKRGWSRRDVLKTTSALAGAAGLAPAVAAPFVSTALAQTKTLKIIQWSHFIPEYDKWIDAFAKDWGKQNGITVTVDHIPHLEIPARMAAEVSAQHAHDLTSLVQEIEKKYGKALDIAKKIAYNEDSKTWTAFPDYYIDFP